MNLRSNAKRANLLALHGYYHLTRPWRAWQLGRSARRRTAPVMVLFYHRVADEHLTDWTIGNDVFERQIYWLRERFDLVSLDEAQRRVREGSARPAVSITFDDGYGDNGQRALPLLVKLGVPCTYFVASQNVLSGSPFAHDLAAGRALRPNTPDEIRALAEAGIEIGAHTRSHADLGKVHDPKRLYDEVVGGAEELTAIAGRRVRYFAFPFGRRESLNRDVWPLLREHGFAGVCSAYGGYNWPGDDAFHLQRIHGDREFARFRNWLTVDPRKLRQPRIDFPTSAERAESVSV